MLLLCSVAIPFARALALEINLSGTVRGVLTNENTYRVTGEIFVIEGDSLEIREGVHIVFAGNYGLEVHGWLGILGGVDDATRVVIGNNTGWRGIYFYAGARPSEIRNCDLIKPSIGIQTEVYVEIQGNRIDAINIGINCIRANPRIRNNRLISASGVSSSDGDAKAISLYDGSNPTISNNELIYASGGRGESYGIYINESCPIIKDNWIEVISDLSAIGIIGIRTDKIIIERNVLRINSWGKMRGLWLIYATNVDFTSNTMLLMITCQNAVSVFVDEGSVLALTNNILIGNGLSIGDSTVNGQIDSLRSGYNDYWRHEINHVGRWQGYNDISADPLFEFEGDYSVYHAYYLSWIDTTTIVGRSPCIDAGSLNIADLYDQFATRSDIGRFPRVYNPETTPPRPDDVSEVSPQPISYGLITSFPNPFNNSMTLSFELASPGRASVVVFDLNGRQLATLWDKPTETGHHLLKWTPNGIPAGEYLIRLELPQGSHTSRVIYLP